MIVNGDGSTIGYISLSLVSGGESAPFSISIDEITGGELKSGKAETAALWGKIGVGAYQELFTNPIDLTPYIGDVLSVDIKAKADAGAVGLNRVFNSLNVKQAGTAAGWND